MEAKEALAKIKVLLGLEKQDDTNNDQSNNDQSNNDNGQDNGQGDNGSDDQNAGADEFKFTKDQYESIVTDLGSVKESYTSLQQKFEEQGQQLESLKESSKLILEQFEKLLKLQTKDSTDQTPSGFSAHRKSPRENVIKDLQDALNSKQK